MPISAALPTFAGITINASEIKRSIERTTNNINPPTGTNNRANGAKDTLIVDLLRVTKRFTVSGTIASTDEGALIDCSDTGGTYPFDWNGNIRSTPYIDGVVFTAAIETLQITHNPKSEGEQDELAISMTIIVGKDFGT